MLPPADKSQAAPACAGRGRSQPVLSPTLPLSHLHFLFEFWSAARGIRKVTATKMGQSFYTQPALPTLLFMSQSKWLLWEVVNGFSRHANQWYEHTCLLEVMSSLPDVTAAKSPVYPPYGAMPNQFNPLGCLTNMRILRTVALSFLQSKPKMSFLLSPRESCITLFFLLHGFHYRSSV